MDRRDFIKLTAITGTSATLASCGSPEHQLIRFVPDEDIVPGVAEWKPSVCPMCEAGCALTVRVMDADVDTTRNGQAGVVTMNVAKKLEGDPKHPISQGGLCARGQASIQVTYHPDRLTGPKKRTGARGAGEFKDVSWDEATTDLVKRLDALAAAGDQKSLAIMTRARRGARHELAAEFAQKFGAPGPIGFDLFNDDVLRRANAISFGHEQLPTLDLARSRFVIGFGADFLGTWNSPVAQNAAYGMMRQGRPGVRGTFVQVESRMSLTGANADEWVPVKPGTEGVFALGLAHVILANKLRPGAAAGRAAAAIEGWSGGLAGYAPEQVERITGVAAKRTERLARAIVEQQPAVAIIAGPPLAHTNAMFHALAVNALNELLGAVGQPGGIFFTGGAGSPAPSATPGRARSSGGAPPRSAAAAQAGTARSVVDALQSAKLLIVDGANPVFGAPAALKVKAALDKIPFVVSFGSFVDDTSVLADLILPDHSFLESWVSSSPESGAIEPVTTVAGPVMKPLYQTRPTAEVLIEVAGRLKSPLVLPWKTAEDLAKSIASVGDGLQAVPNAVASLPIAYTEPVFDGDATQYPFLFLPYPSQQFGDGSAAHLPWLQEMPDPLTSAMWSSWVEINPQTAERLKIAQGDVVEVASSHGAVRAPAMIFPGIAPDLIAMPVGQGHDTFTRYASKRGANPTAILAPVMERDTGAVAWAATRVKLTRVGGADGSLVMFAGEMREHPHEHQTR